MLREKVVSNGRTVEGVESISDIKRKESGLTDGALDEVPGEGDVVAGTIGASMGPQTELKWRKEIGEMWRNGADEK